MKPVPNTLYVPQALWSVAQLWNAEDGLARQKPPTLRINFKEGELYNGTPYNLTLTKLVISPIGYPFETVRYADPDEQLLYASRAGAFDFATLNLRVDGSYYLDRRFLPFGLFGHEIPTSEPPRLASGADPLPWSTRLFNVFRWTFDHPLEMVANASLEVELGTIRRLAGQETAPVKGSIAIEQARGGFWPGQTRMVPRRDITVVPDGQRAKWNIPSNTQPPVGWGPILSPEGLTGQQFSEQEIGGFGAPSLFSGMAVALDQLDLDATVSALEYQGPDGDNPGTQIASVGDRLNMRARLLQGGALSNLALFRDDAPLSLVMPTMTTARVFELAQPIVLTPGQGLSAAMEIPAPVAQGGELPPRFANMQVGIAFTGTAAIQ